MYHTFLDPQTTIKREAGEKKKKKNKTRLLQGSAVSENVTSLTCFFLSELHTSTVFISLSTPHFPLQLFPYPLLLKIFLIIIVTYIQTYTQKTKERNHPLNLLSC